MQRSTTTTRSSDEHRINVPKESLDDATCSDHPMLKKERSLSLVRERLIHCIPLFLFLCFAILWYFSRPVHLATKNGSIERVQGSGTDTIMLDHPFVDFSLLKPVSTSQAPAPLTQEHSRWKWSPVIKDFHGNGIGMGNDLLSYGFGTYRLPVYR